jgi:hypothetical protein
MRRYVKKGTCPFFCASIMPHLHSSEYYRSNHHNETVCGAFACLFVPFLWCWGKEPPVQLPVEGVDVRRPSLWDSWRGGAVKRASVWW